MELFIVTYQGRLVLAKKALHELQPLESNKYQVEFDLGGREWVSSFGKINPSDDHNKLILKLVS